MLARYKNGNCIVTIYKDGTKTRDWPDKEIASPDHPESIDMKITNRCNRDCPWCHENSGPDGRHASVDRIISAMDGLSPGVELAIGGGNPLLHPSLEIILTQLKKRSLIPNITVSGEIYFHSETFHFLRRLQEDNLLFGIGVSDPSLYRMLQINDMLLPNSVCHAIVGVHNPHSVMQILHDGGKVLLLGFKSYGRGVNFVNVNMGQWKYFVHAMLGINNGILSFDNLAIEQLDVRNLVPRDVFDRHYMGDDGKFSMYFDAVSNQYAVSSVSERIDAKNKTIIEMFSEIKLNKGWEHYSRPKSEADRMEDAARSIENYVDRFKHLIQRAENIIIELKDILDKKELNI